MSRCRGRNKDGTQCTNNAIKGKTYCTIEAHKTNRISLTRRRIKWLLIAIALPLILTMIGGGIYYRLGPSKEDVKQVNVGVKSEAERTREVVMAETAKLRTILEQRVSQNIPADGRKPPLAILYQYTESAKDSPFLSLDSVFVTFMNQGDSPIRWFTVEVSTKDNEAQFKVSHFSGDFPISCSGQRGNWTLISGRDMLPGQFGGVDLVFTQKGSMLEDPIVRSDSKYKYYGFTTLKWGPTETYEDYKRRQKVN